MDLRVASAHLKIQKQQEQGKKHEKKNNKKQNV